MLIGLALTVYFIVISPKGEPVRRYPARPFVGENAYEGFVFLSPFTTY